MAGPFGGIYMMSGALRNFQRAMETSGHNVSNVDTPGYSRQRVDLSANQPVLRFEQGWLSLGQGAGIRGISRARDLFLDRNLNYATGNLAKFSEAARGLQAIEGVYREPREDGIKAALGEFFDAWSGLGSSPSDSGARFQVQSAGQTLADRIRNAWHSLDRRASDSIGRIDAVISQVNDLAAQIDTLNKSIRAASVSGQAANDLLDQRDAAVNQLSGLLDVTTNRFDDGTMAVYASGFTVVDSAGTLPFPTSYDITTGTVSNGTITNPVRGGMLAGLFIQAAEQMNQMSRLDALANELRTQINTLHMTGVNGDGTTNVRFFNDVLVPPQTGAIDFDLDLAVKSDLDNVMTGVSGNAGDGGLAHSLAQVRNATVANLGNTTFDGYFQDTIDVLASVIQYYRTAEDTEQAVVDQVMNQIQSVSGVSIDDEMADMVRFQRSYQAAARTLTVFDQLAEDVINMLRR